MRNKTRQCSRFERLFNLRIGVRDIEEYLAVCWHCFSVMHPSFQKGAFIGIFSTAHMPISQWEDFEQ